MSREADTEAFEPFTFEGRIEGAHHYRFGDRYRLAARTRSEGDAVRIDSPRLTEHTATTPGMNRSSQCS